MKKLLIAVAALSVLGTSAAPALADPPRHAKAWGHKKKHRGYGYYGRDYDRRCRRDSDIEGTVIGAVAGGVLGNVVSRDKTLGTVIGAGVGGVIGNRIDHGDGDRRC